MSLKPQVLRAAEFDPSASEKVNEYYWKTNEKQSRIFDKHRREGTLDQLKPFEGLGPLYKVVGKAENSRLLPLLTALADVADAAEDAIDQIKDQRGLWPAEVDTLEDVLDRLRLLVKEKGD